KARGPPARDRFDRDRPVRRRFAAPPAAPFAESQKSPPIVPRHRRAGCGKNPALYANPSGARSGLKRLAGPLPLGFWRGKEKLQRLLSLRAASHPKPARPGLWLADGRPPPSATARKGIVQNQPATLHPMSHTPALHLFSATEYWTGVSAKSGARSMRVARHGFQPFAGSVVVTISKNVRALR